MSSLYQMYYNAFEVLYLMIHTIYYIIYNEIVGKVCEKNW
jgi:hypothetical protein